MTIATDDTSTTETTTTDAGSGASNTDDNETVVERVEDFLTAEGQAFLTEAKELGDKFNDLLHRIGGTLKEAEQYASDELHQGAKKVDEALKSIVDHFKKQ